MGGQVFAKISKESRGGKTASTVKEVSLTNGKSVRSGSLEYPFSIRQSEQQPSTRGDIVALSDSGLVLLKTYAEPRPPSHQHLLSSSNAEECSIDVSLKAMPAAAGLRFRPETRPTGHVGGKDDL
nr:unnamed protein product [Spirometra erinaceieuropaei]